MRKKRKPLKAYRKLHISELPWAYIAKSLLVLVICVVLVYQFIGFRHYYSKSADALSENTSLQDRVSTLSLTLDEEKSEKENIISQQTSITRTLEEEIDMLADSLEELQIENKELSGLLDSTRNQNDVLRQRLNTLLGSSRSGSDLSPSPTGPSGLSLEDLKVLTQNTQLQGIEEALLTIEAANNVNALFALSVSKLESGNGTSYLSTNRNNIFGFRNRYGWMQFDSQVDCVLYFGELIENFYVGRGYDTIEKIGPRYAEGSTDWAPKVIHIMVSDMRRVHR